VTTPLQGTGVDWQKGGGRDNFFRPSSVILLKNRKYGIKNIIKKRKILEK